MIASAADTVAGAVAGMNRSRVNVIVDGASHNVGDKEEGGVNGDSWMDLVKEGERHFSQKIQERLRNIDGVLVSVTVDPNMKSLRQEKETYDKANTIDKVVESTERTNESTTTSRPPGEPGAVPNTGSANQPASLAGGGSVAAGGDGTTSNESETKTKMQVFPSVVREKLLSPGGFFGGRRRERQHPAQSPAPDLQGRLPQLQRPGRCPAPAADRQGNAAGERECARVRQPDAGGQDVGRLVLRLPAGGRVERAGGGGDERAAGVDGAPEGVAPARAGGA